MTEEKHPDVVKAIYAKGDKYYCAECHQEVPIKQSCPVCKKEIDWERVFMEAHR